MSTTMYVKRERTSDGRIGYTGPIRSAARAEREAAAWRTVGWMATVIPATPETRADVRVWEAASTRR